MLVLCNPGEPSDTVNSHSEPLIPTIGLTTAAVPTAKISRIVPEMQQLFNSSNENLRSTGVNPWAVASERILARVTPSRIVPRLGVTSSPSDVMANIFIVPDSWT